MWRLNYSAEAVRYIADNWGLINDLISAIKSLRELEGSRHPDSVQEVDGIYFWDVADHRVYYIIINERRLTNIIAIKPLE